MMIDMSTANRERRLAALVGKRILVGITYEDPEGNVIEHQQLSGLIVAACLEKGIEIEQDESGGIFTLPPSPEAMQPAAPGRYRLRGSGRVVIDPDLVSTWVHRRCPNG